MVSQMGVKSNSADCRTESGISWVMKRFSINMRFLIKNNCASIMVVLRLMIVAAL